MIDMHTKFKVPYFIFYGYTTGAPNLKMEYSKVLA